MFLGKIKNLLLSNQFIRQIHRNEGAKLARADKLSLPQSLKKRLMTPAGPTGMYLNKSTETDFNYSMNSMNLILAFIIGERALISGSVFGLGYLCYHGLCTKKDSSTVNQSM